MTKNSCFIASVAFLLLAPPAHAGWYEVKNYVGTIGTAPVHVSLQTFDTINHGEPTQWLVDGSYYYDAHRIPIPLQGKRLKDGRMALCEAPPSPLLDGSLKTPAASAARPTPCPMALKIAADSASGEWNDGSKSVPIALHQVGSLNDTDANAVHLDGVVEIPMWYHTQRQMLVGVYEASQDCPVSMLHLRVVDIATGAVDRKIPLECAAGMVMTPIYANVSSARSEHRVTVGFAGGKMGEDKVIDLDAGAAGR